MVLSLKDCDDISFGGDMNSANVKKILKKYIFVHYQKYDIYLTMKLKNHGIVRAVSFSIGCFNITKKTRHFVAQNKTLAVGILKLSERVKLFVVRWVIL